MHTAEKPTVEPAPAGDLADAPVPSNLGMKLFVVFIALMGAMLIIDLLRAWIRT